AAARTAVSEAERDREWLEHCVAELIALAPQPGEEAELAEARAAMQKGERIAGDLSTILEGFDGSAGGPALLRCGSRRRDRRAAVRSPAPPRRGDREPRSGDLRRRRSRHAAARGCARDGISS